MGPSDGCPALRLAPPVLLALFLVPTVGAWNQSGGNPERTGVGTTPDGTLDVIASFRFAKDDENTFGYYAPFVVETPHGLYSLVAKNDTASRLTTATCTWIRITDAASGQYERSPAFDCTRQGQLVGYDSTHDNLFACIEGSSETASLVAYNARTLGLAWRAPAPAIPPKTGAGSGWTCGGFAINEKAGHGVIVWSDCCPSTGNAITAHSLSDGAVTWTTSISTSLFAPTFGLAKPLQRDGTAGLTHITETTTGYVVSGYTSGFGATVAWITKDGEVQGGVAESTPNFERAFDPFAITATTLGSFASRAAANGNEAALVFATKTIFAVDPNATTGGRYPHNPVDTTRYAQASPVWLGATFVAPSYSGLVGYDAGGFIRKWEWGGMPGASLRDVIATEEGDLYAVTASQSTANLQETLVRLDILTGYERQRIPLPAASLSSFDARIIPLSDKSGLLVVHDTGAVAVLGRSDQTKRPLIETSDDYPPLDSPMTLTIAPQDGSQDLNYVVAWGDNTVDQLGSDFQGTHRFVDARPSLIRVTAVYPDGTTATTERLIHVGEPRPSELTAIQRAFAPENQNLTFFLVSIAVTGGGALVAVGLRRRRRMRLERELSKLETLCRKFAADPHAGIPALEHERRAWRLQLSRGRLDDAQFSVLDGRAARAIRAWRYRVLGPVTNKLSPHFRQLLDAALDDARVSQEEADLLLAALPEEAGLSSADAERVRALLLDWTAHQAALFQAT